MDERTVTVCDHCLRASCWQGLFYCERHKDAGTVERTVEQLRELGREHPSYFTRERRPLHGDHHGEGE